MGRGIPEAWANRTQTAEILGITMHGLLLLQRDRVLPPDCAACGRIRWLRSELAERRDELREYLRKTYSDGLLVEEASATIDA